MPGPKGPAAAGPGEGEQEQLPPAPRCSGLACTHWLPAPATSLRGRRPRSSLGPGPQAAQPGAPRTEVCGEQQSFHHCPTRELSGAGLRAEMVTWTPAGSLELGEQGVRMAETLGTP